MRCSFSPEWMCISSSPVLHCKAANNMQGRQGSASVVPHTWPPWHVMLWATLMSRHQGLAVQSISNWMSPGAVTVPDSVVTVLWTVCHADVCALKCTHVQRNRGQGAASGRNAFRHSSVCHSPQLPVTTHSPRRQLACGGPSGPGLYAQSAAPPSHGALHTDPTG